MLLYTYGKANSRLSVQEILSQVQVTVLHGEPKLGQQICVCLILKGKIRTLWNFKPCLAGSGGR